MLQVEQKAQRDWKNLQVSTRLKESLNPIRNWAEFIVPSNERKYNQSQQKLERPAIPLRFLMGDPTRYPQFITPQIHKDAAIDAVGKIDGYTDFFGDPQIRTKLAEKLSTEKWKLTKEDIILTEGGSLALFYCIFSLCNPGDCILMPKPTFPIMNSFAQFLGVKTLWYSLDSKRQWQPNLQEIEEQLKNNQNIKFININSPSNPLGSVFNEETFKGLIKICQKYNNIPIVSDEIYEDMVFPENHFKFLSEYSDTVPILRCSGLTKKALVPGWRMGWLAMFGKPGVFDNIKQALRGITNILLMPNTICQTALNQVYENSRLLVGGQMIQMNLHFQTFKKELEGIPGISVGETSGAMYSTIVIEPEKFQNISNTEVFASLLQLEENVLVFPGELFFGKNFIRFVICADQNQLEEACKRIRNFCQRHRKLD